MQILEHQRPRLIGRVSLLGGVKLASDALLGLLARPLGHKVDACPVAVIAMFEAEDMVASQHTPSPHGPAAVEMRIRSAKLGKRLLEQHRPQLAAVHAHEDW